MTNRVDKEHTSHPFLGSEFDVTAEVVEVGKEACKDFLDTGRGLWTSGVNDSLGKLWVELLGGNHDGGVVQEQVCGCVW